MVIRRRQKQWEWNKPAKRVGGRRGGEFGSMDGAEGRKLENVREDEVQGRLEGPDVLRARCLPAATRGRASAHWEGSRRESGLVVTWKS